MGGTTFVAFILREGVCIPHCRPLYIAYVRVRIVCVFVMAVDGRITHVEN